MPSNFIYLLIDLLLTVRVRKLNCKQRSVAVYFIFKYELAKTPLKYATNSYVGESAWEGGKLYSLNPFGIICDFQKLTIIIKNEIQIRNPDNC